MNSWHFLTITQSAILVSKKYKRNDIYFKLKFLDLSILRSKNNPNI